MNVLSTRLPEVLLLEPVVHGDSRGQVFEAFRAEWFASRGLAHDFVQENVSCSGHGVLRGLHLQHPKGQAKLVSAMRGEVYDVAVDVRVGSPTFGQWVGEYLSEENKRLLYVPAGFAHGFCVASDAAVVIYRCTEYYHPETERAVRWNDPAIGIAWPGGAPVLSQKDAAAPLLADVPVSALPSYDRR